MDWNRFMVFIGYCSGVGLKRVVGGIGERNLREFLEIEVLGFEV